MKGTSLRRLRIVRLPDATDVDIALAMDPPTHQPVISRFLSGVVKHPPIETFQRVAAAMNRLGARPRITVEELRRAHAKTVGIPYRKLARNLKLRRAA